MVRKDVVIAVVVREGKVLICQRRESDSFGGFWEFPGGKREADETPEQCLVRELREELQLDVTPTRALAPIEHDYPSIHVRLLPYQCECEVGEPKAIACEQFAWVQPHQLRDYRFPQANAPLIELIAAELAAPRGGLDK
ncbi:MAG TPA: 8-oxo-dGTP diphosphatase MutT [Humisphaera sp.]|jgi:mutator protein MutT|nr:8-oxo-dGTP diphosphatase MutT [Humisphaera sp.]